MSPKSLPYYDFGPLLSRNSVYNFLIGARGLGKTYGAKKWAIKDGLTGRGQFIYLRRYETELKGRNSFFADISQEFPEYLFRVNGYEAQAQKEKTKEWFTIGYFVPLSKAQSKKSVSYASVTKIIFDEFIIDKGFIRYLPNEASLFNDFYSTVDRWQDRTRVLFLANSVSIMNPYFIAYDIKPRKGTVWWSSNKRFMSAHFAPSEEFAHEVYKTRFGQFIKGTEYANYSVESGFKDNTENMMKRKPSEASYYATIETKLGTFSVWMAGNDFYIQKSLPKHQRILTMLPEQMNTDKMFITRSDKILQILRSAFAKGRLWFDSPNSRNAFVGVFQY
jgi:hypothetical protein